MFPPVPTGEIQSGGPPHVSPRANGGRYRGGPLDCEGHHGVGWTQTARGVTRIGMRNPDSPRLSPESVERPPLGTASAVKVLTLDDGIDLSAPGARRDALEALEGGGVVLLPKAGFQLIAKERELLSDLRNILATEADNANGRPTIIFDPARGKIARLNYVLSRWRLVRAEVKSSALADLEHMMTRFSRWAEDLIARLLPRYASVLGRDRVTYRPNQRSAVQPLHVDSAYGYPLSLIHI